MQACIARFTARDRGAERFPACHSTMTSADETLESIRMGRVSGVEAWRKATAALRKYTTSAECAKPSATRYSRKKPRRDARRRLPR